MIKSFDEFMNENQINIDFPAHLSDLFDDDTLKDAKLLKDLSSEIITDPEEFASYIKDYNDNPGDYDIFIGDDYYKAITGAYMDIQNGNVEDSDIFKAYLKVNENVDEFLTVSRPEVTEQDFINKIAEFDSSDTNDDPSIIINREVLLQKGKEDLYKGLLKTVKSKKSGKSYLIYRPTLNIGNTGNQAIEN